jgi:hypothetical protein
MKRNVGWQKFICGPKKLTAYVFKGKREGSTFHQNVRAVHSTKTWGQYIPPKLLTNSCRNSQHDLLGDANFWITVYRYSVNTLQHAVHASNVGTGHYGIQKYVSLDSSVGIATRNGLDGLGIESRWRRDFPHPSRPTLGSTQPPIQSVPGTFRGWSG